MALIKCPECGRQVSSSAQSCPNCGYPVSQMNQPKQTISNDIPNVDAIKKDEAWVDELKNKSKKSKRISLIIAVAFLSTTILLIVLGLVLQNNVLMSLLPILIFVSAVFLIIFISTLRFAKVYVEHHGNYTIAFYRGFSKPKLYVDGDKKDYISRRAANGFGEFRYKLPNGEVLVLTFQNKSVTFDYYNPNPTSVQNQTIVNNYTINKTIKKKRGSSSRSDMEKILIKNAKVDALASIDPTNTEKAKEQIDIVNKLDNLED